jgi:2-keto-4-pentenoate hydratase/2-oxohepta-3-ene-1,7-dioic acid hydratase in catechol pathway
MGDAVIRRAVRYQVGDGAIRLGRLDGDLVTDAGPSPEAGFDATPASWDAIARADGSAFALDGVRLLAPVRPPVVLCIGLNYTDHIAEAGHQTPAHPMVFAKLGSAVIGPEEPIVLPAGEPQPDWEAEMALVIGTEVRDADRATAIAAIGGVTALNDVSGRWAQLTTGGGQYVRGKSFDTFCPLGPSVVHPDDVDVADLGVRLRLNGELEQSSNTRHLLFDAADIVVWLSTGTTLAPGTVIATGTPGGVGFALDPQRFLAPGDVVEVEVDHVGTLRNPVRSA